MTNTSLVTIVPIDPLLIALLKQIAMSANDLDIPWFLTGATARDLLLEHVYGITTGRATKDIDLGVMVENWDAYETLLLKLMSFDEFSEDKNIIHRLYFHKILQVDFIPFGAVENKKETITWPPDFAIQMRVIGFKDAWAQCLNLKIDNSIEIPIVSLAGLLLLKLFAWEDRHLEKPKKDAYDIALIIKTYSDAGNLERLYSDYQDIVENENYDLIFAGARLLGRDLATITQRETSISISKILSRESNPENGEALATEIAEFLPSHNLKNAALVIEKLKQGFDSN